ncbi:RF-1 domain-containing protein [Helicostylum pulchrum]|uniref:Prokaryotic-type class I peptide chain release factors domain-containing protein n=1 Tax=Helicostylum pulchrum TaxID=562976 RepID=A0ABP9YC21_9FUNG|nr:RF-1 domain-containing protein [Helicostylum pulchrum]
MLLKYLNILPSLVRTFATKPPAGRKKIVLNDQDLIETFVKGSGPGGQCINKRSSCVDLRHIPTGIRVQCQQSRSLADNRGIARKLLREKLDDLENGMLSKNGQKSAKIAKQKARRAKRAKEKYAPAAPAATAPEICKGE